MVLLGIISGQLAKNECRDPWAVVNKWREAEN